RRDRWRNLLNRPVRDAYARRPSGVEEFVKRLAVSGVIPELSGLPIPYVENVCACARKRPALTAGRDRYQCDGMLVIGNDVVEFDPQRAVGQIDESAKEGKDLVLAPVLS